MVAGAHFPDVVESVARYLGDDTDDGTAEGLDGESYDLMVVVLALAERRKVGAPDQHRRTAQCLGRRAVHDVAEADEHQAPAVRPGVAHRELAPDAVAHEEHL